MQREKYFRIVVARFVLGLDIQDAKLASVGTALQIAPSRDVSVIPAGSGRARHKRVSLLAMSRNCGRSLIGDAIYVGGNKETVPVHEFRIRGVVLNFYRDRLAFLQTQDRTRHRAVVSDGLNNPARRGFELDWRDAQREIGRRECWRFLGRQM